MRPTPSRAGEQPGPLYFALRVAGGRAADRRQRRKPVAGSGCALSAACTPGLLAAGSSVPVPGAVIAADRTGKGLRTGPRDALIAPSSTPRPLGRFFGAHRAPDTTGAFPGPPNLGPPSGKRLMVCHVHANALTGSSSPLPGPAG